MKRKHKVLAAVAGISLSILIIYKLCFSVHVTYDTPLNTIESIRYFEPADKVYAYHNLTLTPTDYYSSPFSHSVVAKALYRGNTIGFKITIGRNNSTLSFESIGKESDDFVKAIYELYDEKGENQQMRGEVEGSFWNGEAGFVDWNKQRDTYKIIAKGLNGREAEISLDIDIPNEKIILGDKNSGLSKQRFVNAFIKQ